MGATLNATGSKPQAPSTVYILDGDERVRDTLASLAVAAGWQVEAFASAERFLSRSRGSGPSCLVMDVDLADCNGLALQARLACQRCETPVIFVTAVNDVQTIVKAMKAGAMEFLVKPVRHDEVVRAMAQALDRSRRTLEAKSEIGTLQDRYSSLSAREQQVLTLVVSGLLNKQVGFELGISEITVKAHRGRLMRKMGAGSLAALVKMAGLLGVTQEQRRDRIDASVRSAGVSSIDVHGQRRRQFSLMHDDSAGDCDEHGAFDRWQPVGGTLTPQHVSSLRVA